MVVSARRTFVRGALFWGDCASISWRQVLLVVLVGRVTSATWMVVAVALVWTTTLWIRRQLSTRLLWSVLALVPLWRLRRSYSAIF